MSALVDEWVSKAEGDFRTAGRELEAGESPNYDAVCFHAQQAVEKLMKAALIAKGQSPTRSHDLAYLDEAVTAAFPGWSWPKEELRFLSRAAIEFRYPGESAGVEEAQEALDIASRMRDLLLSFLGR